MSVRESNCLNAHAMAKMRTYNRAKAAIKPHGHPDRAYKLSLHRNNITYYILLFNPSSYPQAN